MPYLCRMCKAECETDKCEVCGSPAPEVDKIYKLVIEYTCIHCLSTKQVRYDHDKPDSLDFGHYIFKRCPLCDAWRGHAVHLIKVENEENYEKELNKLYAQELKKGE